MKPTLLVMCGLWVGVSSALAAGLPEISNRFATTAYPGVEAATKILLQADLNEREVNFLLASVSKNYDDLDSAVDLLEDAVDASPNNVTALLRFAQASCMMAGHPDTGMLSKMSFAGDCRESYEKATALDAKALSGWQGLFEFYRMAPGVAGGGLDKAEMVVGKIAALDPAQAEVARASLAAQQDQPVPMREHFAKAVSLNPAKTEEYRLHEAQILMNMKDYQSAYDVLQGLLSASNASANVQYQLGRIAVQSEQAKWYGEAEQHLLAYLELNDLTYEQPDKSWAAFRLGQLYELMGKAELAKQRFEWAASQKPDSRLKGELKKKSIKV